MKLENKSKEGFEITFDGETYPIPTGKFDVNERRLGTHIVNIAKKFGYDVIILEDKEVKTVVKPEVIAVRPELQEVKEEVKEEEAPKTAKKAGGATTASLPQK